MLHIGPHRPAGLDPASLDRLLIAVIVAGIVVLIGELILLLAPLILETPWPTTPTMVPDPFFPRTYA